MEQHYHIFLSYSRTDTAAMQRLRDDLRAEGLLVWTDEHLTLVPQPDENAW